MFCSVNSLALNNIIRNLMTFQQKRIQKNLSPVFVYSHIKENIRVPMWRRACPWSVLEFYWYKLMVTERCTQYTFDKATNSVKNSGEKIIPQCTVHSWPKVLGLKSLPNLKIFVCEMITLPTVATIKILASTLHVYCQTNLFLNGQFTMYC